MTRLCKFPIFTFINILLFSAGVGAILLTVLKMKDTFWSMCPQCPTFHYVMIGVGCFLIFEGLIGLMSTEMKSKWLLILYKFFLFLLFLCGGAFVAMVIMLKLGTLDHAMEVGWDQGVDDDPENVCEFMKLFKCSGWVKPCPIYLVNATASCPVCPEDLKLPAGSPDLSVTCMTRMHDIAQDDFKYLLIGGCSFVVFIVLVNFIAYCNGRQFRYLDDPDDYISDRDLQRRILEDEAELRSRQTSRQTLASPSSSRQTLI